MMTWLHKHRPSHNRNMFRALGEVEAGARLRRQGDGVKGWMHVREAIRIVVDCGCPRTFWPELVQSMIAEVS